MLPLNEIIYGNTLSILKTFPDDCIDCVITSPPYYGLRDYGIEGQLGLEPTLEAGIVLDPFMGSGTTAFVARELGRNYIGIELSKDYIKLAENRLAQQKIMII